MCATICRKVNDFGDMSRGIMVAGRTEYSVVSGAPCWGCYPSPDTPRNDVLRNDCLYLVPHSRHSSGVCDLYLGEYRTSVRRGGLTYQISEKMDSPPSADWNDSMGRTEIATSLLRSRSSQRLIRSLFATAGMPASKNLHRMRNSVWVF